MNIISSVTIKTIGEHDFVRVWNRGALAGELTVIKGHGEVLARRLLNLDELEDAIKEDEGHGVTRYTCRASRPPLRG